MPTSDGSEEWETNAMEQFHRETVAPPTASALRGVAWSAPVRWAAMD